MTPIYKTPTHVWRDQISRVFHRDKAGQVVAEFSGPQHAEDAIQFCELFGEENGDPKFGGQTRLLCNENYLKVN